jgi:hypothetical protein
MPATDLSVNRGSTPLPPCHNTQAIRSLENVAVIYET